MPRKSKIATKREILETLTEIMRSEETKVTETMSAAEKLYKYIKEDDAEKSEKCAYGIVILPEVNLKEGSE